MDGLGIMMILGVMLAPETVTGAPGLSEMEVDVNPEGFPPREMALTGYEVLADSTYADAPYAAPINVWGLDLTRRAAELGDPVALNNLGYFSATGALQHRIGLEEEEQVSLDPGRAVEYYSAAMRQRMLSAAINLLDLSESNPDLGIAPERLAEAHMMVAKAHALGNSLLPYSFEEANKHFLEAARLGNQDARRIILETLEQFPDAFDKEGLWEGL